MMGVIATCPSHRPCQVDISSAAPRPESGAELSLEGEQNIQPSGLGNASLHSGIAVGSEDLLAPNLPDGLECARLPGIA